MEIMFMLTKEKYFKTDSLVKNVDDGAFFFKLLNNEEKKTNDFSSYFLIIKELENIIDGLKNESYFIDTEITQTLIRKISNVKNIFGSLEQLNIITHQNIVYDYLGAYFDVLIYLFSLRHQLTESNLIEKGLINRLVNLGKYKKDNKEFISLFNPLILNIILMGNEKYTALNELCEFKIRSRLHRYLFLQKTARLLADRIIYDGEKQTAYKVNGIKTEGDIAFSLKLLDSNGSNYEEIDLSRIAEKIYLAAKNYIKGTNSTLNCIITGIEKSFEKVRESTDGENLRIKEQYDMLIEVLNQLIERDEDLKNKTLKICYKNYEHFSSHEIENNCINLIWASSNRFFEVINEDKQIHAAFILDAMFLYTPFYVVEQRDDASFLNYLEESIIDFYNDTKKSKIRGNVYSSGNNKKAFLHYKNLTPIQDVADRLTAMFKTPYTYNCKFNLDVKEHIISNLNRIAVEKNKLFYIFISKNETFFKNRYNDYQFVRAERYNGKDIKIVRLAKDSRQILLSKHIINEEKCRGITITAYQFIKMFLSDKEIISDFFGEPDASIIEKLMAIALNFNIKNSYNKNNLIVTVSYASIKERDFEKIFSFFKQIISYIFQYETNNFIGDKSEDNLSYCVRKGLYYALLSKAKTYEQILLAYLIKKEIKYFDDVEYDIKESSYDFLKELNSIDNYAYLHNVIKIIKVFEKGATTRKIDELAVVYWKNGLDEKFETDLEGVLKACKKLDYCQSTVYQNILNYLN